MATLTILTGQFTLGSLILTMIFGLLRRKHEIFPKLLKIFSWLTLGLALWHASLTLF